MLNLSLQPIQFTTNCHFHTTEECHLTAQQQNVILLPSIAFFQLLYKYSV